MTGRTNANLGSVGAESVTVTLNAVNGRVRVYYISPEFEYRVENIDGSGNVRIMAKNSIFGSGAGMSNANGGVQILATVGTAGSGDSAASFALASIDGSVNLS